MLEYESFQTWRTLPPEIFRLRQVRNQGGGTDQKEADTVSVEVAHENGVETHARSFTPLEKSVELVRFGSATSQCALADSMVEFSTHFCSKKS